MSPQNRTLIVIAAMAFLGVSSLAFMAHRYGKILERRPQRAGQSRPSRFADRTIPTAAGYADPGQADESAARLVESFIAVRQAIRGGIEAVEGRPPRMRDVTDARERALAQSGMDRETYVRIRRVYRAWRDGRPEPGTPLTSALEASADRLRQLDLGEYELLDS